jgi:putative peptidoglycan lipid II flippase
MATGTAASRLTGQIRTILLAAAIGTTGLAANAYQAGSMIPQVVFTLVSGGIFNAVLVPQIVRTLQQKDAEDRLNKLITFAVVLLLAVTLLMTAGTPLLTRLYVGGGSDMLALTNAFTLWCMPQIFFYGLYTVVGQILAAKDHFGTYAWSSVGANVISSVGFVAFIALFGRADRQPLGFWTTGKIGLTAGMWTLGVAFQALVLFLPLRKAGIRYRPSWGLKGIGLRAMGPVAAWSVGIVAVEQLATIINTNVTTSAPDRAARLLGLSQFDVAGNASYQNAYTIYILPYSLIAVSVATAMFPRISRAVAGSDIASARASLSQSLRNVGLMMCFFTAVFLVMPTPITLALLPSISVHEAALMAGPAEWRWPPICPWRAPISSSSAPSTPSRTASTPSCSSRCSPACSSSCCFAGVLLLSPVHWATLLGASISSRLPAGLPAAGPHAAQALRRRSWTAAASPRTYAKDARRRLLVAVAGRLADEPSRSTRWSARI